MASTDRVTSFLEAQAGQTLLRFMTCGSVDDGKSTLIGRLLWECQQIFDDQLAALAEDSIRHGTQGDAIDFALLMDGLAAEREQGITIDVAYRFFSSPSRRYIVADTPGHEQYTRNMVTGASTAQAAVLLVDATKGLSQQTRRHAYLVHLLGIRHVALAVNKMDLVGFDADIFRAIEQAFLQFAEALGVDAHGTPVQSRRGFDSVVPIAVSALRGDNLTKPSAAMPWYRGPTLMNWLEAVPVRQPVDAGLVFPVQWVNRPDASFRGYCGTLAQGQVTVGDTVRVAASGALAEVAEIVAFDGPLPHAVAGAAVTLRLTQEVDASRGDVFTHPSAPLETSDQFEATLVWLHADTGHAGRTYDLKLATQQVGASVTAIRHRVNVNTLSHEAATELTMNDVAVVTVSCMTPLTFAPYVQSQTMGSFILIDRLTHATVAAGLLRHSLRRASNVHRQALTVGVADRERMNGHRGQVLWFTGLPGSGKSTLANAIEAALHSKGVRTYLLDGDNVRQGLCRDLGFTDADRIENIRRVAEVACLMADAGLMVITAFISPFERERAMARDLIGPQRFVLVHASTPLEVCEARDPKGLYAKARAGQLPNLTGVGSPYETPSSPDWAVDTQSTPLHQAVGALTAHIVSRISTS